MKAGLNKISQIAVVHCVQTGKGWVQARAVRYLAARAFYCRVHVGAASEYHAAQAYKQYCQPAPPPKDSVLPTGATTTRLNQPTGRAWCTTVT